MERDAGLGPILVVDDSPEIASLIAIVLREAGFVVESATDHQEGLREAKLRRPSLVLLDAVFPTPDGQFVAALRDMYGDGVPIVVVSGLSETALQDAVGRTGAIDAIRKPFDIDDLVVCVRRVLDGSGYSHPHSRLVVGRPASACAVGV